VLRRFNFLYGSAVLVQQLPFQAAFEYQAWAFNLNSNPLNAAGPLNLDGDEYDYCPGYLTYNFNPWDGWIGWDYFSPIAIAWDSYLSLSPCQQDLRQDRAPVCTKAKFDVWDENEGKHTGAYQCVKCYFEGILEAIGTLTWSKCDLGVKCKKTGVGGSKFSYGVLHTDFGRFRVSPENSTACNNVFARFGQDGKTPVDVCSGNQYKSPFLGVLLTEMQVAPYGDYTFAGTTGTQAGIFSGVTKTGGLPPQILWDAAEVVQDGSVKR